MKTARRLRRTGGLVTSLELVEPPDSDGVHEPDTLLPPAATLPVRKPYQRPLTLRWHGVCNFIRRTGRKAERLSRTWTRIRRRDGRRLNAASLWNGEDGAMKHSASRELYDYWNRVRGTERAPHRGAIEPSDIRRVLADTFILEVAGRENFGVRLAGTRVCSIYCRELKGSNFFDLWGADDRSAMATLAAAVTEDGAAAVVTIEAKTARDQSVAAELILLPLRHTGAVFDRVLGSLAVLERPYWLGTEPVVAQTIASLRLIWPDEAPKFMRRRTDSPAAARLTAVPKTPIPFPVPNSRRRGHLFVVDGGKE